MPRRRRSRVRAGGRMLGWRRRKDGFEWREYVRTTILVRRKNRRDRIVRAGGAAVDGLKVAGERGAAAGAIGAQASARRRGRRPSGRRLGGAGCGRAGAQASCGAGRRLGAAAAGPESSRGHAARRGCRLAACWPRFAAGGLLCVGAIRLASRCSRPVAAQARAVASPVAAKPSMSVPLAHRRRGRRRSAASGASSSGAGSTATSSSRC